VFRLKIKEWISIRFAIGAHKNCCMERLILKMSVLSDVEAASIVIVFWDVALVVSYKLTDVSEVCTAVSIHMTVFLYVVAPCSLAENYRCFRCVYGEEYENDCLLEYYAMNPVRNWPTFQR
jgi:hypothetical protein